MKKNSNTSKFGKNEELGPVSRIVAGLIGGLIVGWAFGGLAGALYSGILGAILGGFIEECEKRQKGLDNWW